VADKQKPQIAHLEVTSAEHHIVHLFHRKERSLRNLVLNECVSFVFVCQVVVAEADRFHRTERQKRLLYRVLVYVKVYAPHIDTAKSKKS